MTKSLSAIPNNTDNRFVSLGELLITDNNTRKVSVATLATAIEEFGIYSWDKYGRFKNFDKASPECIEALRLLEVVYKFEIESYKYPPTERHPIDYEEDSENPYLLYGWATKVLPDFDHIRDNQLEVDSQKIPYTKKHDENNLRIIGALLEYINGEAPGIEKHPSFTTEAKLIEFFDDKYKGYKGLSQSNLSHKFPQAKRLLKSI